MAQPNPYIPNRSFSDDASNNIAGRSGVLPGEIDNEFSHIAQSINKIITNLQLIQRDDLRLRDESVEIHALSREVLMLLGNYRLTGIFKPNALYERGDVIADGEFLYVCAVSHESGALFIDDDNWRRFGAFNSTDAMISAQNAYEYALDAQQSYLNIDKKLFDERINTDKKLFDERINTDEKISIEFSRFESEDPNCGDALVAVKQQFAGAILRSQDSKNREYITVEDFGAISKTESEQKLATSIEMDLIATKNTAAFNAAIAAIESKGGGQLFCVGNIYVLNETIELPFNVELIGSGTGEWDGVYRADVKTFTGTTLLFKGVGTKQYEVKGITSRPHDGGIVIDPNDSSVAFRLSSFMNKNAVGATPATPKKFSVAITAKYPDRSKGVRIRDLRICPYIGSDGISKYIDYSATNYSLSDDWDVGLMLNDVEGSNLSNVQIVGHWRIAGIAELSSGWTYYGQSERNKKFDCIFQGKVGYLLRHGDQFSIVDSGYDTTNGNFVAIPWFSEHFFENTGRFAFSGVTYTWNGLSFNSANNRLVFQNVKKLSDGSDVSTVGFAYMRPGYGTSGAAGTELSNVRMFGFDHSNGNLLRIHDIYAQNGLGSDVMSTPLEISGYPCRGIQMYNSKCQSAERVTAWLHDCTDLHAYGFQVEGLAIYNCYAIAKGSAFSDVRDGGCEKLKLFGFVPDTSGVKYSLWSPIKAQIYGDNGWSGGLPVDFGGTGATTPKAAKSNLNLMRYLTIPAGRSITLALGADLFAFQMTISTNAVSVGGALFCGRAASGSFVTPIASSVGSLITNELGTPARLNVGTAAGGNITIENLTALNLTVIVSLSVEA